MRSSGKIRSINRRIEQAQDVMIRACFNPQAVQPATNKTTSAAPSR
jgi:hypothetical protein